MPLVSCLWYEALQYGMCRSPCPALVAHVERIINAFGYHAYCITAILLAQWVLQASAAESPRHTCGTAAILGKERCQSDVAQFAGFQQFQNRSPILYRSIHMRL